MARIAVAATAPFGADVLERLAARHDVAVLLTRPDAPAGRGRRLVAPPAKEMAGRLAIPVLQPERPAPGLDLDAPTVVVCAYGLLVPDGLLAERTWLNVHPSLLPRWRGAAPVERAIMAGDAETGVSIMAMEAGLDSGPVLLAEAVPIGAGDTAGTLHDRLAGLGARLVVEALARLDDLVPVPQPEAGVNYAAKLDKAEARVDWRRPAAEVDRLIRGLSPFPGAWTEVGGERVKLLMSAVVPGAGVPGEVLDDRLAVACGEGAVRLLSLQRAGGGALEAAAFLRGRAVAAGQRIG